MTFIIPPYKNYSDRKNLIKTILLFRFFMFNIQLKIILPNHL